MTAFYIGRTFFVVAMGDRTAAVRPHDPPAAMSVPLVVLAVLAVGAGLAAPLIRALGAGSLATPPAAIEHAPLFVPLAGTTAALAGFAIAFFGYQRRAFDPARVRASLRPLVNVLERRWYVDDVFEAVYRFAYMNLSRAVGWFDRYVVDGVVNAVTWATWIGASRLSAIQNGRAQDALYATAFGLVLLLWLSWAR
jgi:NADH-quinone oxidoreductase subunit L